MDKLLGLAAALTGVCLGIVIIDYLYSWIWGERGDRQEDVFH